MKNKIARILACLLVSISMLFTSIPVFADSPDFVNIALNKPYTFTAFDPLFPDTDFIAQGYYIKDTDNKELTDGIYDTASPKKWSNPQWCAYNGWKGTTSTTFKINLGAEMAIQYVKPDYFSLNMDGFGPPLKIIVSLSSDGQTWYEVKVEKNVQNMKSIMIPSLYKATYVKIECLHSNSWFGFDEVEVMGSSDTTDAIDPSQPDMRTKNIAAGKEYSYTATDPLYPDYDWSNQAYPDTENKELTNGVRGNSKIYSDSQWAGYNGWKGTTTSSVQFDFETPKLITQLNADFLVDNQVGISYPKQVNIFFSLDSKSWTRVYTQNPKNPSDTNSYYCNYNLTKAMKARYVKIDFIHENSFVFLDEVEVMGSNDLSNAVDPIECSPEEKPDPEPEPDSPRDTRTTEQRFPCGANVQSGYMKPSANTDNIHDLVLLYNQYYKDGTGDFTAEKIRPYLTYVDRNSKATDKMMDGVLFLALNGPRSIKVGDTVVDYNFASSTLPAEKIDFDWYIDKTFAPNGDVAALNEAAATAARELNDPNYKAKMVIMVPCPSSRLKNFGDFGSMSDIQNQKAALTWYMDEVLNRFNNGNYEHIKLSGLYWLNESISDESMDIAKCFSDFTHQHNLKSFWIPYYDANGSTNGAWRRAGMDAVAYQPNHYFTPIAEPSRITDAAEQAGKAGMGIEIETGPDIANSWDSFDRHTDYLDGSILYGYNGNNAFRAHYQWVVGYQRMSNPTLINQNYVPGTLGYERGRRGYEDLYKMMKGNLKLSNRAVVDKPTLVSTTHNSVTLAKIPTYEYSIDTTNWQSSPVFSGLAPKTSYTFYQRVAGDFKHEPSLCGAGLEVTTNATEIPTPTHNLSNESFVLPVPTLPNKVIEEADGHIIAKFENVEIKEITMEDNKTVAEFEIDIESSINNNATARKPVEIKASLSTKELVSAIENALTNDIDFTFIVPNSVVTNTNVVLSEVIVDKEVFEAAKAKGKNIEFNIISADGKIIVKWEFKGSEIKSFTNVNLAVNLLNNNGELTVSFKHSGILPTQVTITLDVNGIFANGEELFLYYKNEKPKRLDFVSMGHKVVNGNVAFQINHCSDYVLTKTELKSQEITPTVPPKTGVGSTTWIVYVMLIVGCLSMIIGINFIKYSVKCV